MSAASAYLQLPPEAGPLRLENVSVIVDFELRYFILSDPFVQAEELSDTADLSSHQPCNNYSLMYIPAVCMFACYQVEKRRRQEVQVCVGAVLAFMRQWMKAAMPLIIERVLNNKRATLARQLLITGKVSHFWSSTFSSLPPPHRLPHLLLAPLSFFRSFLSSIHSSKETLLKKHLSVF